ncbi:MAG: aromatic amino acid hydroxylase [Bacteroidales bacterium]
MESNEILDRLPKHLMSLVIDQPYNDYTAQDHAIWRYVMRQNVKYLQHVAHHSYLNGLKKTGVSLDFIPHMYGMNRILKEIGWAAVAVDGFIPPSAFMEFQAYNVLVIAADIRPIDQVEYTPAPDIIHEAAGHAPIIADPEYSKYLVRFGELGSKAFSSARDYELYEAIRHLSIIKADPYTTPEEITRALHTLEFIEKNIGEPSEMSLIRNLHWWTVEYGLIGSLDKPRIYGAGLLSSIGESYSALNNGVKKLPYTLAAMHTSFDITTKQPQLFVTPDFEHLTNVLEEFADTMALRKGGIEGVKKAIESANIATCVYSTGLQVTGVFSEMLQHNGRLAYIRTNSPTQLSYNNKVLEGHGKDYHSQGFGSPVGKLQGTETPLEHLSDGDLHQMGITEGSTKQLVFTSGIQVEGRLIKILRKEGKLILLSFNSCTVSLEGQILFHPDWGTYDMAVGSEIISAFSGPADPDAYGFSFPVPVEKTHKIQHSKEKVSLHHLYQVVRDIRDKKLPFPDLIEIWTQIRQFPKEWLLPLEILELLNEYKENIPMQEEIIHYLTALKAENKDLEWLISKGLDN